MPFTPAPVDSRSRKHAGHPMSFRVHDERGKPRLEISAKQDLLDQVKGSMKFWRLDLDEAAGLGRLTGLIQNDGHNATRRGTTPSAKAVSRRFSWDATALTGIFPQLTNAVELEEVTVTSMGLVFRLPVKPKDLEMAVNLKK